MMLLFERHRQGFLYVRVSGKPDFLLNLCYSNSLLLPFPSPGNWVRFPAVKN